jgi:L-ribulose-5-phosphate 4-epimerase
MLEELKADVCRANLDLAAAGLVVQTFGNVSGLDRATGLVVIKPSGLSYAKMKPDQMVVVALASGEIVEGALRPSSDTPTHLELYRAFPNVGGIVHTHSLFATAWAQAQREIPALGTTHADFFPGPVPCTRPLTAREIRSDYEVNTGRVIAERFARLEPGQVPGVLVAHHGPFTWGRDAGAAVQHAVALEFIARLAAETLPLRRRARGMPPALLGKHFTRKHGPTAYYGQPK